ncbi:hypothetical protein ACQP1K_12955 [Sphaerimonospora sp. CA-214678]|uniref:hypothetical protein n=1 Tax=Sphaerimonospora sp. CA-214678 TaxID=3240029 RepID=UPI003D948449
MTFLLIALPQNTQTRPTTPCRHKLNAIADLDEEYDDEEQRRREIGEPGSAVGLEDEESA